jgi:hypothetical protein
MRKIIIISIVSILVNAQKDSYRNLKIITLPVEQDTFDICNYGYGYNFLPFYIENNSNDTLKLYPNHMYAYYSLNKSTNKWVFLGSKESQKVFDLCKSSEFDPKMKFSKDYTDKIRVTKNYHQNHKIYPGINSCSPSMLCQSVYVGLKIGYEFEENDGANYRYYKPINDTVVQIKVVVRVPIAKNKYIEKEHLICLTNKYCNNGKNEKRKFSIFLDSISKKITSIDTSKNSNGRASLALQFHEIYKKKNSNDSYYKEALNPYYFPSAQKEDTFFLRERLVNFLYKDTLFSKIIAEIPSKRTLIHLLEFIYFKHIRYFANDYERQVQYTRQLIKLFQQSDLYIKKSLPDIFEFLSGNIKAEGKELNINGVIDYRVLNDISKLE